MFCCQVQNPRTSRRIVSFSRLQVFLISCWKRSQNLCKPGSRQKDIFSQETKEGQSQELNNGVEAEFEEAPQATNGQVRGGTTHKFQGQSADYTHRNMLFWIPSISFHCQMHSDSQDFRRQDVGSLLFWEPKTCRFFLSIYFGRLLFETKPVDSSSTVKGQYLLCFLILFFGRKPGPSIDSRCNTGTTSIFRKVPCTIHLQLWEPLAPPGRHRWCFISRGIWHPHRFIRRGIWHPHRFISRATVWWGQPMDMVPWALATFTPPYTFFLPF